MHRTIVFNVFNTLRSNLTAENKVNERKAFRSRVSKKKCGRIYISSAQICDGCFIDGDIINYHNYAAPSLLFLTQIEYAINQSCKTSY